MKTLTLQTRTAVEIMPGVYDREQEICTIDNDLGMYVETLDLPESLAAIQPASVKLYVYSKNAKANPTFSAALNVHELPDQVRTAEGVYPAPGRSVELTYGGRDAYVWNLVTYPNGTKLLQLLTNGIYLTGGEYSQFKLYGGSTLVYGSVSASYAPYLVVTYEEGQLTTFPDEPQGYIARGSAHTFSWHTGYANYPVGSVAQTSATLQWKNGENGTVNSISISGSATTYTMAANTLPASTDIRWRVVAVTAEGTSEGRWATVRTTDATTAAVAVSPSSGYVDSTKTTRFTWRHEIETGTESTGYELQYKQGSGSWTALASGSGSASYCDVAAGSLPTGALEWRVRTKNAQGVAGTWSAPLSIVVIGAPTITSLKAAVKTARPELTWSSPDQQAYQVQIGSYDSGIVFGQDKRWKSPEYIPAGSTTARVRVINEYRMWSDWAQVTFTIPALPNPGPDLTVSTQVSANLTWETLDDPDLYLIYRDGVRIGRVPANGGDTGRMTTPQMVAGSFNIATGVLSTSSSSRTKGNINEPIPIGKLFGFSLAGWRPRLFFYNNGTYLGCQSIAARRLGIMDPAAIAEELGYGTATEYKVGVYRWDENTNTVVSSPPTITTAELNMLTSAAAIASSTNSGSFTDRMAAPGGHTWYVRAVTEGSDYPGDSDYETAVITVDSNYIADADGDWLDIGTEAVQNAEQSESRSASVSMLQLAGTVYPTPEVTPQRQHSARVSFATTDAQAAARFEAMVGKLVILKTRYGRQIIGMLNSYSRSQNWAIIQCSATVTEVDESVYQAD